jgi:signal transduction histidine kinase
MKPFMSSYNQDHPRNKSDRRKTRMDKSPNEKNIKDPKETIPIENEIGMIIHEIRNPLTAISLSNQSLHEQISSDHLPPSLYTITEVISKNITRIETLLKDLLHINCSQADFLPTDICEVIENSLEKAGDRAALKKVEISKSYCSGLLIQGNVEKLALVFLNIIINAIEATKKEEGKIWITAYKTEKEVKVVFKDNGIGMEPGVAAHMFDKNFSCKSNGLGVGLAHVKQILEWHDAFISVNSEPGSGTSIVLVFKPL